MGFLNKEILDHIPSNMGIVRYGSLARRMLICRDDVSKKGIYVTVNAVTTSQFLTNAHHAITLIAALNQ